MKADGFFCGKKQQQLGLELEREREWEVERYADTFGDQVGRQKYRRTFRKCAWLSDLGFPFGNGRGFRIWVFPLDGPGHSFRKLFVALFVRLEKGGL